MSKVLSAIMPKMGILALDASAISKDPEVVKAYVNDPLVFHSKTPARLAAEMLKAMIRVTTETGKITLPFIAVQGGDDKLVDPGGIKILEEKAGSKDKTIKIYEGYYHEVFNEPGRQVVLKDVEDWLKAHL
jgi:alpha-beta hydrolase superfamily lysophospholipase